MGKLVKIGITNSIGSIMPILMWYLIGITYGSEFQNMFTLTYAFQFIYLLLFNIFVNGSIKYQKKENNSQDNSYCISGIMIGAIIFTLIIVVVQVNLQSVLNYYEIEYNTYKEMYIFGIVNLLLDYLLLSFKTILQYSENNKGAFNITLVYYLSKIINIFIIRLFTTGIKQFCLAHITLSALIITLIVVKNREIFKAFKFKTNILNYMKYSLKDIPSSIGMLIIYGLGISKVTTNSSVFLASYNAVAMSTDTQWDILSSSIDTNTSIKVLNNEYEKNKKKLFVGSIAYSILLMISSIIIMLLLYITSDNLSIDVMFTMFLIECSWFPIYAIRYTMMSWLSIENPCKEIVIISTSNYILRTFASMTLTSNYALSIGVMISAIYANTLDIILYFRKHKTNSNIVKKKGIA